MFEMLCLGQAETTYSPQTWESWQGPHFVDTSDYISTRQLFCVCMGVMCVCRRRITVVQTRDHDAQASHNNFHTLNCHVKLQETRGRRREAQLDFYLQRNSTLVCGGEPAIQLNATGSNLVPSFPRWYLTSYLVLVITLNGSRIYSSRNREKAPEIVPRVHVSGVLAKQGKQFLSGHPNTQVSPLNWPCAWAGSPGPQGG